MAVQQSDDRLIIGLDFGTTYSGISYCFSNQKDCVPHTIDRWPGSRGSGVPKIPTRVCYDKSNPSIFTWGAETKTEDDCVARFKLLLDPSQPRPGYLPAIDIEEELKKLPKPAVQVAKDYIEAIHNHAMQIIEQSLPPDYVKSCTKEYVLSVPAVWSEGAKNATLKAAKMAGIRPVNLIKEPEAAALWTAKNLSVALEQNDAFVVCDAGGGTVDLISYQVEATTPRLQVKELVPGTGGVAGSTCLNERFKDAVHELVGDQQWSKILSSKAFDFVEKAFDTEIKRDFMGNADSFPVNFPKVKLEDDLDHNLDSGCWNMQYNDLKKIFDPVVDEILELIRRQVEGVKRKLGTHGPKYIFLVGGFGGNEYLMNQVKEKYPDITVLRPLDAWAAISKGAVLSRISSEAVVTSSSATRHYGVKANSIYEKDRDEGRPTILNRFGETRVETMTWYINIGDDLIRDKTLKFSFFRTLDEKFSTQDLIFKDSLFESDDETAPVHPHTTSGFRVNCTLTADLSDVPREKLIERKDQSGQRCYNIEYDLIIGLDSTIMSFSLEIDGVSYGTAKVDYD